jgi:hypothetical protein
VWPTLVVFVTIVFDHHARFCQRPESLSVQTLVAEATVEALHEAVLPRATRLNVDRLNLVLRQPSLDRLRDELGPVVRPQVLGSAVLFDGFLQPRQYVRGAQRSVGPQDMALAGVFVQDGQHPQRPAAHGRIGDEVPGPDVPPMRGFDR